MGRHARGARSWLSRSRYGWSAEYRLPEPRYSPERLRSLIEVVARSSLNADVIVDGASASISLGPASARAVVDADANEATNGRAIRAEVSSETLSIERLVLGGDGKLWAASSDAVGGRFEKVLDLSADRRSVRALCRTQRGVHVISSGGGREAPARITRIAGGTVEEIALPGVKRIAEGAAAVPRWRARSVARSAVGQKSE